MRQHAAPLLLSADSSETVALSPVEAGDGLVGEAVIQALVQEHPECLPIAEIDPLFSDPVPICTELNTTAGSIDNFLLTKSGLPVLVECKLWRNPEARREVVGQILDYAKELRRWSSSDLQREVSRRLKRNGNPLLEILRAVQPEIDEIQLNDTLTSNLRRGRFLLLIVGDGIREGVEAITEYLQAHAGLRFSFGLVEMPIYRMPDGKKLIAPRVLARTAIITRNVVAVPEGYLVEEQEDVVTSPEVDADRAALGEELRAFWQEFLNDLRLDDPEQPKARAARSGHIEFSLPAPTSWLTVYRNMRRGEVGIAVSYWGNTVGETAVKAIADDWANVRTELGGNAKLIERKGRPYIYEEMSFGPLDDTEVRKRAFHWLAERTNAFVNTLRPRARSAAADYQSRIA